VEQTAGDGSVDWSESNPPYTGSASRSESCHSATATVTAMSLQECHRAGTTSRARVHAVPRATPGHWHGDGGRSADHPRDGPLFGRPAGGSVPVVPDVSAGGGPRPQVHGQAVPGVHAPRPPCGIGSESSLRNDRISETPAML
jgi:hypothetical protein